MLNYILYGFGIGTVSTFIYAILNNSNPYEDNTMDYSKIFCIIMFVSILILFITSGGSSSQSVAHIGGASLPPKSFNNSPPF